MWRFRKRLKAFVFDRRISGILDTAPMPVVPAPWSIVSMVADSDVRMYLLAIKSFYARIGSGQIVAIVDRDQHAFARRTLSNHLPGIEFVILEDIDTGRCQRGGTWERLCYILDRSEREYVIQIDADTLPFGDNLDEVKVCLEANRAFTMGGSEGWIRRTLRETAAEARTISSNYVGIVAERHFDRYPDADRLHYVRGSSGFAGFARGGFARARIEEFHDIMRPMLGARWTEWGTEQCGSNFAVANSPDPVVLDCPLYRTYDPSYDPRNSKFLHFIGSWRFENGVFVSGAKANIAKLKRMRAA